MSSRQHPGTPQPGSGNSRFPDPFAPGQRPPTSSGQPRPSAPGRRTPPGRGQRPQPWNAPAPHRDRPGPAEPPLEGTVHPPRSRGVAVPRRRGRWLTTGVPVVLGGTLGFSTFIVLGVSSLIGGAGLITPLLAGLGVAVVLGGGTGYMLRNRTPKRARLSASTAEIPEGTRPMLEKVVKATTKQRRRLGRVRRRGAGPAAKPAMRRAHSLMQRIDALIGAGSLQSRGPSDGDVMMLEGMATRYIPDLLDALEETIGLLASVEGDARRTSLENLQSIDQQLRVLEEGLERIENDVAAGITRSLDVHAEFLKLRFADQRLDPIIDV